MDTSMKY